MGGIVLARGVYLFYKSMTIRVLNSISLSGPKSVKTILDINREKPWAVPSLRQGIR